MYCVFNLRKLYYIFIFVVVWQFKACEQRKKQKAIHEKNKGKMKEQWFIDMSQWSLLAYMSSTKTYYLRLGRDGMRIHLASIF